MQTSGIYPIKNIFSPLIYLVDAFVSLKSDIKIFFFCLALDDH